MRRAAVIIILILVVLGGVGYWAIQDEHAATGEIGALQDQVLALQKEAGGNPSKDRLNRMAIQLDDIRSELSYIPSRHRLAFLVFSNLQTDLDEVTNLDVRVAIPINQRR